MCKYAKENICTVTNEICPWMFLCSKDGQWKPNKYMPQDCPQASKAEIPSGYYNVRMIKGEWLYVDLGDRTIKLKNTLSYAPKFVKLIKRNGEYRIKKEGKGNEGN